MHESQRSALTEAFRFAMILLIVVGGGIARYWTQPLTRVTAVLIGGLFLMPLLATIAWLSWRRLYYDDDQEGERL